MSYLTIFYYHDLKNPFLGDGPLPSGDSLLAVGQMRKPWRITRTGTAEAGYQYATPAGLADWSPNFGRVAYTTMRDRLLKFWPDPQGQIDLPSFYEAQEKSGIRVLGPNEQISSVSTRQPPRESAAYPFGIIPGRNYQQDLAQKGLDEGELLNAPGFSPSGIPKRVNLLRYEVNGNMWSSESPQDNLEMLLECAPGAKMFRSYGGKYKIAMPDSDTPAAMQLVDDPVDGGILVEGVTVIEPDPDEKANRLDLHFPNIFHDFAHDTVIVPQPSVREDSAWLRFLALDNDVRLTSEDSLELTNNVYHAYSIGATNLLLSRRKRYAFATTEYGVHYEGGDVLRLVSPDDGLDVIVRLEDRGSLDEKNGVPIFRFEALEFVPEDFKFYNHDKDEFTFPPLDLHDLTQPKSIVASYDPASREIVVTAEPNDNSTADEAFYVFEVKRGTGDYEHLAQIGSTEALRAVVLASFDNKVYQFRVASKALDGGRSAWREGVPVRIDGRIQAALGSQIRFVDVPPGQCPPAADFNEGDVIVTGGGTMWTKAKALTATEEGSDGVLAHLTNVSFTYDATSKHWKASLSKLLPSYSQLNPPGYWTELWFGDGTDNRIGLGQLTGAAPTWVTATTPDEPAAADGVVGQAAQAPDGQRWARGAGIFEDEIGEATGILGRLDKGTFFSNGQFQFFFSGTDPSNRLGVADYASTEEGTFLNGFNITAETGAVRLDFESGPVPPFERTDLTDALESNLVVAMRKGSSGDWTIASLSGDADDPYEFTPADSGWSAFVASLSQTQGERVQIVLLDKSKRASDPANNPWYRQTDAQVAKAFAPGLADRIVVVARLNEQGGVHQFNLTGDATNPYEWTQDSELSDVIALSKTAPSMIGDIWLVNGGIRCIAEVNNPWLPNDFTAGADGLGLEWIFKTTTTDASPGASTDWNSWAYDRPQDNWFDGVPDDFGKNKPYVWVAKRAVPGAPPAATPKEDSWGDWELDPKPFQVWGQDGEPGVAGLPGMSRIIYMDKRKEVEVDPTPDDPNPTNPTGPGEYSFLERNAGSTGTTTQNDITSWTDLYNRRGDNENLTLRHATRDMDGVDHEKFLRSVPKGGVITWMPMLSDGTPDVSHWIDFTIEQNPRTNQFFDGGDRFVGFHIESIEHVGSFPPCPPTT